MDRAHNHRNRDKRGVGPDRLHRRLPLTLQRLQAAPTLDAPAATLAAEVRTLTGFDRVMVYRFDPQWNGEVVAEARRGELDSTRCSRP